MRLRITIAMLEIRNRKTLQSKVNICKSDVKIGDYGDSLTRASLRLSCRTVEHGARIIKQNHRGSFRSVDMAGLAV